MITYTYKQLEQEKFVKINNEYISNKFIKKFNIDSMLILSMLLKNYTIRGEIIFSLNYLFDELGVKRNNTNRINKIKQILSYFSREKILDTDVDFRKINSDMIVKVKYNLPNDNFTIIYDFEIDQIINSNAKVDKYSMFYLFVFMKYRMNISTQVMYWSINDMASELNTKSNKTIINYTSTLRDLGLIRIDNIGMRVFQNGDVKSSNNIYTLGYLENAEDIINSYMERYRTELEEKNIKIKEGKSARKQTSLKNKMNYRHPKFDAGMLTDDELAELYKIEEEYYEFIKNDPDKIKNTRFVLFKVKYT